ncbi:Glycoside hydrolase, family 30 [Kalmanozyma brasiliensis GHG001]|uniref:Glycosyl hydrolase family 30 TIM-barrel domain-containing protein n=1 Tax=Kalmanozyma brasiliensis (strain GHG001) TaxID=1365824 RepID=V5GR70_KALBG|nr:Glycoside hydrolase, family 30 [Kalmanozyma brasiliensis GHG001]EST08437.1 Glycoside hydrolase, family 30 [Kalmanozyma brasiliensis GHG001]
MKPLTALLPLAFGLIATHALVASSQSIVIDQLWSTTWNYSAVQELTNPSIAFVPGAALTASINVTSSSTDKTKHDQIGIAIADNQLHQVVDALGGGITDSVAITLQDFKTRHPQDYDDLLHLLFSPDSEWLEKGGVGMNTVRVPLGASDFGISPYTFDDTEDGSEDPDLELFTIKRAPKLWKTLRDIVAINPALKIIVATWSAPAWMKEGGNPDNALFGGSLKKGMEPVFAKYLVRAVSDLKTQENLTVFAMSPQNEPGYAGTNYPTMKLSPDQSIKMGSLLRSGLDAAGFQSVKLFLYDFNWDNPNYPLSVLNANPDPWDAVAWHGYAGSPSAQKTVTEAFPDKDTYFTEMTRVTQYFSEPYKNMKNTARDLLIGSIRWNGKSLVLWNLILRKDEDGFTSPHLPNVCSNCNAAVLLLPDASDSTTGTDADAKVESKRSLDRRAGRQTATFHPSTDTGRADEAVLASKLVDAKTTNNPSVYASDLFKRTSDFSVLAHLSAAIRPMGASKEYARRIGVTSTDETTDLGGRMLAQAFRQDGVRPGVSRFSVILLNQNDHYESGVFEAATSVISFRGMVANVTTVPGLYTIAWEAPTIAGEGQTGEEVDKKGR